MATLFKKLIGSGSYETPVYQKSYQGKSIALSEDGLTMAIGAPANDQNIGCCFIYTRDTMASPWIQESNRIRGFDYKGQPRQGTSVSLTADGNTLAIGGPDDDQGVGAVWMFKRIDGSWYQTQDKIFSWAHARGSEQNFGKSVSLSGDGLTMAIGVPRYKSYLDTIYSGSDPIGGVVICFIDKGIWKIQENKLIGGVRSGIKSYQGTAVSLSYDGTTVAISGSSESSVIGDIFVFTKENTGTGKENTGTGIGLVPWTEVAHEVFFKDDMTHIGKNVNISGDGNSLAYGAYGNYNSEGKKGNTLIFLRKNNIWQYSDVFVVGKIPGLLDFRDLIDTPCFSRDGLRLAIGAFSDQNREFELLIKSKDENGIWNNLTNPIYPGVPYDTNYLESGYATVMSGNGLCIAIGISKNDKNIGAVKTYTSNDQNDPSNWTESDLIISPNFIGRPNQGNAIILSEDGLTLIVGGYLDSDGQGSVWVFERKNIDKQDWKQSGEKLIPTNPIGASKHGYSLAMCSAPTGDILVVGGPGDNNGKGAAWVYQKGRSGWVHVSKLVESSITRFTSKYGSSVCISDFYSRYGIRIATGGPNDNDGLGGVLLFDQSEFGWSQSCKIEEIASLPEVSFALGEASLGSSVAISGDGRRLAVGCPQNGAGCVLFFHIENSSNESKISFTQDADKIQGPGSIKNSKQGSSISLDSKGEILAIGGPADNGGIGATWIFHRINNKWESKAKIICPTSINSHTDSIGLGLQGSSVNLTKDGTHLIIGGPGDNNMMGAAWAYKLIDKEWIYLDEKYVAPLHNNRSTVGSSVAIAYSNNGNNGNLTVAYGAPIDNEGVGGVWVSIGEVQAKSRLSLG